MSPPPSLLDMPNTVLNRVLEKSNFVSILTLRKVCHNLRNFIDDVQPEAFIKEIEIHTESNLINVFYDFGDEVHSVDYQRVRNKNECEVDDARKLNQDPPMYRAHEKIVKGADFLQTFLIELGLIFPNIKKNALDKLVINRTKNRGSAEQNSEKKNDQILEHIRALLSSRPKKLKVKKLQMNVDSQSQVMAVLPYLEPEVLEILEISDPNLVDLAQNAKKSIEINEIMETEQWRKLKFLNMNNYFLLEPIQKFLHFPEAVISLETMSMEDMVVLRNALPQSPNFKSLSLHYKSPPETLRFAEVFGPAEGEDIHFRWFCWCSDPQKTFWICLNPVELCIKFSCIDINFSPEIDRMID